MNRVLLFRVAVVTAAAIVISQTVELAMRAVPLCGVAVSPARCHFAQFGPLILSRRESHGILTDLFRSSSVAAVIAFAGCLLIVLYMLWIGRTNWFVAIAVGLQVGGALSNLFDRVVFGVTGDFLAIGIVIMNTADLFIMVGAGLAILAILYEVVVGDNRRQRLVRSSTVL